MNARYVGLTPYAAWYSFFSFPRIATTLDMSTSIALVTWADVSSERRMCSGMPRRMAPIGSNHTPPCGSPAAAGAGAALGAEADGASGAAGAAGADGAGAPG